MGGLISIPFSDRRASSEREAKHHRLISHPPAVASTAVFGESTRWQERMGKDLPLSLLDMLWVSCQRIWGVSTFIFVYVALETVAGITKAGVSAGIH